MPVLIFGEAIVKLASSLGNCKGEQSINQPDPSTKLPPLDFELLEVLIEIFKSEWKGDLGASDKAIKNLKSVMATKDVAFKGSAMQDATEFFGLLLSEVRDSLDKLGLSEQNIINSTFAFEMEEVLVCNGCQESSLKVKSDISMWCNVDRLDQEADW